MEHLSAHESFAGTLTERQITAMEQGAEACIAALLSALRIAPDAHTEDTPRRVARMLVREVFAGRYAAPPVMTDFPAASGLDQIDVIGPIAARSCCAHHLVPVIGKVWIGMLPGDRLLGLSKAHRMVDWIMSRPQVQERATEQLADAIVAACQPKGLAIIVRARHFCCAWRGVRDEPSLMTTSVMRGVMREGAQARAEFMSLITGMGYA